MGVSILVLLESGLGADGIGAVDGGVAGFNPCSAGIRSGRFPSGYLPHFPHEFQSLFCWNQVWEFFLKDRKKTKTASFNPCSAGIRSGSGELLLQ